MDFDVYAEGFPCICMNVVVVASKADCKVNFFRFVGAITLNDMVSCVGWSASTFLTNWILRFVGPPVACVFFPVIHG